jgi:high affinity Mn2+ porin
MSSQLSLTEARADELPNPTATETATELTKPTPAEEPQKDKAYSLHLQATAVPQTHPGFHSPYQGPESLRGNAETDVSFSNTYYFGYQLFKNTEVFLNPELIAGSGVSDAYGLGAYPNGEINRVGSAGLQLNIARAYLSQTFPLGSETEFIPDDLNQIAGTKATHYLRVSIGKYSLADYLDFNTYAHDQRTQFLNFCFMDNCAWDYAMNPIGYIYAATVELNEKNWALRLVAAMEPTEVNGATLDTNVLQAHSLTLEYEQHYTLGSHPGVFRLLGFYNDSRAKDYAAATSELLHPNETFVTDPYHRKYGGGVNVEQEITKAFGTFFRVGANDGQAESFTFTEDDFTATAGLSLNGRVFHRDQDTLGIGFGLNELSTAHANFLASGGRGLMLGDGRLNYAPEEFMEVYYSLQVPRVKNLFLTPDFQYVVNPGFNADRGPVPIFAARLHYELGSADFF